jgi:hypothetical protein
MNNTINTGGAEAGIQRKNELIAANAANKRMINNVFKSSMCII